MKETKEKKERYSFRCKPSIEKKEIYSFRCKPSIIEKIDKIVLKGKTNRSIFIEELFRICIDGK